jgi:hypothetical protein
MEKRLSPRKKFKNKIGLDLTSEKAGNFSRISIEGTGIDISQGGIGIITKKNLEKGGIVKLLFPLHEEGISVPVFSVIKWTDDSKGKQRVGLQFLI